jgi:hypothetical protein
LKAAEAELERERAAQLKLTEKGLKARQRRRLAKQVEEKEAELARLAELKAQKLAEKSLKELRLYAEGADLVPEHLQEAKEEILSKALGTEEPTFVLDKADKDQLALVEVRHSAEMEKALKAAQVELDQDLEDERQKLDR